MSSAAVVLVELTGMVAGLAVMASGISTGIVGFTALGAFVLFVVGLLHLWLALSRFRAYWSVCDLHAASLLIAYFGGAAVTIWLAQGGVIAFWSLPDFNYLVGASLFVAMFVVALRLLGRVEAWFWRPVWQVGTDPRYTTALLFVALAVLGLAQLYMLLKGYVTYGGTGTLDGVRTPYIPSIITALSWPVTGLCGWVLGNSRLRANRLLALLCIGLLPLQVLFYFGFGRRVMLFQILVFLTCLLWSRGRGIRARHALALGAFALPLVYMLWVLFSAMRVDSYADVFTPGQQRNIFERLKSTQTLLDRREGEIAQAQKQEVVNRVFIIGALVDLMEGTRRSSPLNGNRFLFEVVNAVPRIFLPAKYEILRALGADSDQVLVRFGQPAVDRADSVVVSAYTDFLWFGPLIYPPLVMLIGILLARIALLGRFELFKVYVVSYAMIGALSVEQQYFTYNLGIVRTTLALGLVLALIRLVGRRPRVRRLAVPAQPSR